VPALCLLLVALVACGGRPDAEAVRADVQRVLDRRAEALLDRDERALAQTGARAGYDNLRAVPLADWAYRVKDVRRSGDTVTADTELRYRVRGVDRAPVTTARTLRLSRDADGRWSVDRDRPAGKSAQQLWDQGPVRAVHGRHSLVLGVGQSREVLERFAGLADRAVPAVSDAWRTEWSRHVVVLVPGSLEGMAGLLGSPASSYRGIAAVTTGETGARETAPADRIVVNPDAYGTLGSVGRQVVLTHETTHVASRAHTTPATPLWLSEGYADWVGYRGTGRTPQQAAPELAAAVTEGRLPTGLPEDGDFGFDGDANALALAYESGWTACRMIAGRWGEERLGAFYRAVGGHGKRAGAVEDALRQVLGTTPEDFTAEWRDYLRSEFG
jgi:ketosteroid isomerase-like protein